jgi:DNA-binding IclR family transcriptional regulator
MTRPAHNQPLRRGLKLALILAGHEMFGLRTSEIAKAANLPDHMITRDLQALLDEGFIERTPRDMERWRLGPKLIQVAQAHVAGLAKIDREMREVAQRCARDP